MIFWLVCEFESNQKHLCEIENRKSRKYRPVENTRKIFENLFLSHNNVVQKITDSKQFVLKQMKVDEFCRQ